MEFRSGLGIVTFNLGISGLGFGGGYLGEDLFFTRDNSIRKAIKDQLGRKLISESNNSDNLYLNTYREYKYEIDASKLISRSSTNDVWSTSRGGNLVKSWCEKALDLKLVSRNSGLLPYIVRWCVISQNVKHKLLDSGKKLLIGIEDSKEKKKKISENYKKFNGDSTFKRVVLKNKQMEFYIGYSQLENWCSSVMNSYSDFSENNSIYGNASKWCVVA